MTSAILVNKNQDEVLQSLDFKVIEARKKIDLLQHEINQVLKQETIFTSLYQHYILIYCN